MQSKILVSACLMGFNVRYNASAKAALQQTLERWEKEKRLVVHCPELAAGLRTPRPAAEIISGDGSAVMQGKARILERTGQDVTAHYQLAAWLALEAAQKENCCAALLTDGSPTCGSQHIYDGTFSGTQISGKGVASALLEAHGIKVFSHDDIAELIEWVNARDNDENSL
ncbi:DUF523 domain-containing protein [Yokenella regensburgei]|uniref:DUF523 domain-containing protein n=1 Tax=Yokenella regensburgei TaxID=158877 RepID=UPI003F1905E8